MMGKPVTHTESTDKSANCITFTRSAKSTNQPLACIRCGACADICPEHLLPQQLYTFALNFNATALTGHQLHHCIECACCDVVCPSHLPLAQYFKLAKQRIADQTAASQQAEIARQRFEKREQRLAASPELKPRRSSAKQINTDLPADNNLDSSIPVDNKKALIEAALKRRKKKNRTGTQGSSK